MCRVPSTTLPRSGELTVRTYPYLMREHAEPKPRDDRDATQDIAKDLADIASQLASLKGEARAWLRDPNYNTLKLRLEAAHSALEAAAVEAKGGGCGLTRGDSLEDEYQGGADKEDTNKALMPRPGNVP